MSHFIYTMKGLGKIYPPDQKVFEDIWLSFIYGAKIGIIGGNGSGKSTLMRIMAGVDPNYLGEAFRAEGAGYACRRSKGRQSRPQAHPAPSARQRTGSYCGELRMEWSFRAATES